MRARLRAPAVLIVLGVFTAPAQEMPRPRTLPVDGSAAAGELKGSEWHDYSVRLGEGEFLYAVADEHGIDLGLRLIGDDGKVLIERDQAFVPPGGLERLMHLAPKAGTFILRVSASAKEYPSGSYRLSARVRVPTQIDILRRDVEDQYLRAGAAARAAKDRESLAWIETLPAYLAASSALGGEMDPVDQKNRLDALRTLAQSHRTQKHLPQATEFFERTIKYAEEIGNWKTQAAVRVNDFETLLRRV